MTDLQTKQKTYVSHKHCVVVLEDGETFSSLRGCGFYVLTETAVERLNETDNFILSDDDIIFDNGLEPIVANYLQDFDVYFYNDFNNDSKNEE